MRVLVTMLGKGRRTGPGAGRYEETSYRFPGGTVRRGPYFGLELAKEVLPHRIVIIGTASSMWDVLIEDVATDAAKGTPAMEELRLELMASVEEGRVDGHLLDLFAPAVAEAAGCEVQLRLIPAGIEDSAQRTVLEVIAAGVEGADTVAFDVTHGYRHLGMLGFLSTFAIERMRAGPPVKVEALWYGAYEMAVDRIAPAVRLDGLMRIQQWVDALNRFDANGNYGVFAPLLEADGMPGGIAGGLREAAFLESNINLGGAGRKLEAVLRHLEQPLPGASGMFQERLRERIAWVRLQDPAARHYALAGSALQRQDYLRASILALEGFLAGLVWSDKGDPYNYKAREQAKARFLEDDKTTALPDVRDAFKALNGLRNALAHGTPPETWLAMVSRGRKRPLRELLGDSDELHGAVGKCIETLRGWRP